MLKEQERITQLLISQCSGVFFKQGRRQASLAGFELTLWSEHRVFLTEHALVYQRILNSTELKGTPRLIPYSTMSLVQGIRGSMQVRTWLYALHLPQRSLNHLCQLCRVRVCSELPLTALMCVLI